MNEFLKKELLTLSPGFSIFLREMVLKKFRQQEDIAKHIFSRGKCNIEFDKKSIYFCSIFIDVFYNFFFIIRTKGNTLVCLRDLDDTKIIEYFI